MVPAAFRLDTVSAHLVERLEAVRRSFLSDPEGARAAFRRVAQEVVEAAAEESREYVDLPDYPEVLRRELLGTFLPRYERLALEHSALESRGYGAWRGGDPAARLLQGLGALLLVSLLSRILRSPVVLLFWAAAVSTFFMPELRAFWYRLRYRRELQAAVDDMGRIADELEAYQPAPARVALADAGSAAREVSKMKQESSP